MGKHCVTLGQLATKSGTVVRVKNVALGTKTIRLSKTCDCTEFLDVHDKASVKPEDK